MGVPKHSLPHELVIVRRVAFEHQAHSGLLESGLYLGPDSFNRVEFRGVGDVEDWCDTVLLHELFCLLTVVDSTVVHEDDEVGRRAPL